MSKGKANMVIARTDHPPQFSKNGLYEETDIFRNCSPRLSQEHRLEGRSGICQRQGIQSALAVLSRRGNASPNLAECSGAFPGTESPRYLLLDFHHANIPFRLLVVKRHPEIPQEQDNRIFVLPHPFQWIHRLGGLPAFWIE